MLHKAKNDGHIVRIARRARIVRRVRKGATPSKTQTHGRGRYSR